MPNTVFLAGKGGYEVSLAGDKRFAASQMNVEVHGHTGDLWFHIAAFMEVTAIQAESDPMLQLALTVDRCKIVTLFYKELLETWFEQNPGLAKELMVLAGSHNNTLWNRYTAHTQFDHAALLAAALTEYCIKIFN